MFVLQEQLAESYILIWLVFLHLFSFFLSVSLFYLCLVFLGLFCFSLSVFHICFHGHTPVWLIGGEAGLILRQGATGHCAQNVVTVPATPPESANSQRV